MGDLLGLSPTMRPGVRSSRRRSRAIRAGAKWPQPNGHPAAHHWRGTIEAKRPQGCHTTGGESGEGGAGGERGNSDRGGWGVQSGLSNHSCLYSVN